MIELSQYSHFDTAMASLTSPAMPYHLATRSVRWYWDIFLWNVLLDGDWKSLHL